ncbi:MAG: aminoacyl-tRNA hydrolase [Candidatus Omnitrophica bacterium]|jgi:PTH1 family peptidyl-tRNA hydrolase|nr:aminoacyl-tRNA hydrolase [Candidatus Omnitrophota bacterium]
MKLIVGLGNPGRLYANSRHNVGALTANTLARRQGYVLRREKTIPAMSAKVFFSKDCAIVSTPLTYMNLSGPAVGALMRHYRADLTELVVVYDDLDLVLGSLRMRPDGSAGGHNGMRSVIAALGSNEFSRLRIGIGRPQDRSADTARYVLSAFGRREKKVLLETVDNACSCLETWVSEGTTRCMNIFNKRGMNE